MAAPPALVTRSLFLSCEARVPVDEGESSRQCRRLFFGTISTPSTPRNSRPPAHANGRGQRDRGAEEQIGNGCQHMHSETALLPQAAKSDFEASDAVMRSHDCGKVLTYAAGICVSAQ